MILESKEIRLRPIEKRDTFFIMTLRNNPINYAAFFEWEPITLEKQEIWFNKQLNDCTEKNFMIDEIETKYTVGMTSLVHIDYRNGLAEYGRLCIDPDARGKQYGAKSEWIIHNYAFNHLNLHKVYCDVIFNNERVIKMHEKTGYVVEGVFKNHIYKHGVYVDVVRMGIFKDQFNQKEIDDEEHIDMPQGL